MARIAVHGHFYQPPREDPWTGAMPLQPSAAPFHDWNERVHAESYRPNAFATIPTADGEIIVNNYERLSFNLGPTLLSWMETADRITYEHIIGADRESLERLGHGNAIAQSFHHTILPLSPHRDVRTQVRWGLADFRYRFGRESEGMWLPETAVNEDVLEILIEEGVAFTILAPNQAARWRDGGADGGEWSSPPVDPRIPHRWMHRDGSGRSIALFFYDGEIARQIAFERAGSSAEGFIELFLAQAGEEGLVHAATDGETYGHHHVFTDLGLAYALFIEAEKHGIEVTNYGAYLEEHPVEREAGIVGGEGSSWSCAHGVGRWARNCGCHTGGEEGWTQEWRAPLRAALDVVRDAADEIFERLGASIFLDPWEARDRYVDVVIGARSFEEFLPSVAAWPLDEEVKKLAHGLLRMQERAMAMYTSCGWFFNDIGGIETIQVLRYAAAAVDSMRELGQSIPEQEFIALLEQAKSNDPEIGTGADVYLGIVPT